MPQDNSKSLAVYRQLLAKVEDKFSEIHRRNESRMKCGQGCHSCCVPNLTVFAVEKENLRNYIAQNPGLEDELRLLEDANPHGGTRCSFLRADGACAVYLARPLVCRSHGAPLFFKDEEESRRDICPLNFSEISDLSKLEGRDFINVDLLNTILATVNKDVDVDGARHPLRVADILK